MDIQSFIEAQPTTVLLGILLLVLWTLVWKGFALWRAASRRDLIWFIVLFVFNTFGILEILYLRIFSKRSNKDSI